MPTGDVADPSDFPPSDFPPNEHARLLSEHQVKQDKGCFAAAFQKWWDSCTLVSLTAAAFAAGAALSFKVLSDRVSVFQILVFRSLVALPLLGSIGYHRTGCIFGPKDSILKLVLRGLCAALDFTLIGISINLLPLSEAVLLANCHPVVMAILQWCLGMDALDKWTWMGVVGTMAGQVLIAHPPFLFGHGDEPWDVKRIVGIFFAFMSSVFRSIGLLIVTKIDLKVPPIVIANYPQLITLCLCFPLLFSGFSKPFDSRPSLTEILLYLGATADAVNQVIIIRSFQIGPAIKAAILSLSRVLMAMALGLVVCSDKLTFLMAAGAALLLASIVIVIVRKNTTKQTPVLPEVALVNLK